MIEPQRMPDLMCGDRTQVVDIALSGTDPREHMNGGGAQHAAVVRADAVRGAVIEAELRRPATDHCGDELVTDGPAVDDLDLERREPVLDAGDHGGPRAVASPEPRDRHPPVLTVHDLAATFEEHGDRLRIGDGRSRQCSKQQEHHGGSHGPFRRRHRIDGRPRRNSPLQIVYVLDRTVPRQR